LKRLIFLTGSPGVGKTSVLRRTLELLTQRGFRVGGMISSEIREGGNRVGFEVTDVSTGRRGVLAHIHQSRGPKVGKYTVNLEDLATIGAGAIREAVRTVDIIVIDEVGPMELFSREFRVAVEEVVESGKTVVGIIHYRARGGLIDGLRSNPDAKIIEVTLDNREGLPKAIAEMVL
jgi:nucleoside-triphosphatase